MKSRTVIILLYKALELKMCVLRALLIEWKSNLVINVKKAFVGCINTFKRNQLFWHR